MFIHPTTAAGCSVCGSGDLADWAAHWNTPTGSLIVAESQPLCQCGRARVEHVGRAGACPRQGWPEGTHEAKCGKCGETFNPSGPGDLEHGGNANGQKCGGLGVYRRTWNPSPRRH